MKRIGRRLAIALTLTLTLVVATAACGGGGDDGNSAATETTKARNDKAADGPDASTTAAIAALESDPAVQEVVSIAEKSKTYVGTVEGTDGYIALVDNGAGVITAYVCDGSKVGAWAEGERTGDKVSASGASGLKVDATITGSSVSGTVVVPAWGPHAFSASLAKHPAGLWQPLNTETGEFAGLKVGWIVLEDESQRGLALTSQKKLNLVEPVNTVNGPAGNSAQGQGPVTTAGLSSECQTLKNIFDHAVSTYIDNPTGDLRKAAAKVMLQTDSLYDQAGCPGTIDNPTA